MDMNLSELCGRAKSLVFIGIYQADIGCKLKKTRKNRHSRDVWRFLRRHDLRHRDNTLSGVNI